MLIREARQQENTTERTTRHSRGGIRNVKTTQQVLTVTLGTAH